MSGLNESEAMASGYLSYFLELNQATLSLLLVASCATLTRGLASLQPRLRNVMVDC